MLTHAREWRTSEKTVFRKSVPNKILKALHERADSRPLFVVIEEGLRANDNFVHHLERTNPEAVAQARWAAAGTRLRGGSHAPSPAVSLAAGPASLREEPLHASKVPVRALAVPWSSKELVLRHRRLFGTAGYWRRRVRPPP